MTAEEELIQLRMEKHQWTGLYAQLVERIANLERSRALLLARLHPDNYDAPEACD